MNGIRLLIDTSKCVGCKACQVACQQWHSLPAEDTAFTGSYQNPRDLSAANLTVTKFAEFMGTKLNWFFSRTSAVTVMNPLAWNIADWKPLSDRQMELLGLTPQSVSPTNVSVGRSSHARRNVNTMQFQGTRTLWMATR